MIRNINTLHPVNHGAMLTGFTFFDDVIDGLPYNRVTIFHGSPGFGKSTVARQIAANADKQGLWTLYVSAEEEAEVQALWFERHHIKTSGHIDFFERGDDVCVYIEDIINACKQKAYSLLIIDSIQKLATKESKKSDSSLDALLKLYRFKKEAPKLAIFVIAQETKSRIMAGSNKALHEADILLEGQRDKDGDRFIRYEKNREGRTDLLFHLAMKDGLFTQGDQDNRASIQDPTQTTHTPIILRVAWWVVSKMLLSFAWCGAILSIVLLKILFVGFTRRRTRRRFAIFTR